MDLGTAELVTLVPDVILAIGGAQLGPLLQASRTVPIVFVIVPDPVGSGFVRSSGAAARQRHRLHAVRIQPQREMAGTAQGDSAIVTRAAVLSGLPRPVGSASSLSFNRWRRRSAWS